MSKLTYTEIQQRIDAVEGRYYKGYNQSEEWWRITGEVHPTDRRLWTYYHNLLNKITDAQKNIIANKLRNTIQLIEVNPSYIKVMFEN